MVLTPHMGVEPWLLYFAAAVYAAFIISCVAGLVWGRRRRKRKRPIDGEEG